MLVDILLTSVFRSILHNLYNWCSV